MRRMTIAVSICFGLAVFCVDAAHAQQQSALRGAAEVIRQLESSAVKPAATPKQVDQAIALVRRIDAFALASKNLPADEAATGWLQLLDEAMSFSNGYTSENPVASWPLVRSVFEALPAPLAWPAISQKIDARPISPEALGALRAHITRLLGHALTDNKAALELDGDAIQKLLLEKAKPSSSSFLGASDEGMRLQMVASQAFPLVWYAWQSKPPGALDELLMKQLDRNGGSVNFDSRSFSQLGDERARPILEKYISRLAKTPGSPVIYGLDGELFQQLVQKHLDEFSYPAWSLVDSPEDLALYEAFAKKFPDDESAERRQAQMQYMQGLIQVDRVPEALEQFRQLAATNDQGLSFYFSGTRMIGHNDSGASTLSARRSLTRFYEQVCREFPSYDNWSSYRTAATASGELPEMIAALNQYRNQAGERSREESAALERVLIDSYLANDQVDDAIALYEVALNATKPEDARHTDLVAAFALAKVGKALNRPESVRRGLNYASAIVRAGGPKSEGGEFTRAFGGEVEADYRLLADEGCASDAELLLSQRLGSTAKEFDNGNSFGNAYASSWALYPLAQFYDSQSRFQDVVDLLDQAPWWGHTDLSEVPVGDEIMTIAARALSKIGRTDEARRVVDAALLNDQADDELFELLVEFEGPNAIARLDRQFALDPLEERPLIWKAKLLLQAGKLDEAEQTARQAIAIDPSDGEQGPGKRMIVYAVLADVLDRQPDEKKREEAAVYRRAVSAIRLAEQADKLSAAGLTRRAIAAYEEATKTFVDAYCIQSRLALELASVGKLDEAAQHYRKAFELMPDSFGRIESHCFGCEGVFSGELAEQIAENVLAKLSKERPDKPQIHYLLGYLREVHGRTREAIAHYREAVRLDPDYYNAWKKIVELSIQVNGAPDDDAALAVVRLGGPRRIDALVSARDLQKFWVAIDQQVPKLPSTPDTVYPLAASKLQLERMADSAKLQPGGEYYDFDSTLKLQGVHHSKGRTASKVLVTQCEILGSIADALSASR